MPGGAACLGQVGIDVQAIADEAQQAVDGVRAGGAAQDQRAIALLEVDLLARPDPEAAAKPLRDRDLPPFTDLGARAIHTFMIENSYWESQAAVIEAEAPRSISAQAWAC